MGTTDERQSGAASTNLSEIMMAVAASADRVLIIHGRKERRVLDRCATCLYSDVAPGTTAAGRRQPLFLFLWFPLFQVAFWCISEKEATLLKT